MFEECKNIDQMLIDVELKLRERKFSEIIDAVKQMTNNTNKVFTIPSQK